MKRTEYIESEIERITKRIRLQTILLKEYELGYFFSIPRYWYFFGTLGDEEMLQKLQNIYMNSEEIYQPIPAGLFNLNDLKEREMFFKSLEDKLKNGIIIDFSYIPESYFLENELEKIEDFKRISDRNREIEEEKNGPLTDDKIKKAKITKKVSRYSNDEPINKECSVAEINRKIAKIEKEYEDNIDSWDFCYRLYENISHDYQRSTFRTFEVETLHSFTKEFEQVLRGQFFTFRKEDAVIDKDLNDNQKKSLKKQMHFVNLTLDCLDKMGFLESAIQEENEKIDEINKYLPIESKIEKITGKESIYDELNKLDFSKQEDLVLFYAFGRNVINKLAHHQEEYIFANLKLHSNSESEYKEIKNSKLDEMQAYILDSIEEYYFYGLREEILDERLAIIFPDKDAREKFFKDNIQSNINKENGIEKIRNIISSRIKSERKKILKGGLDYNELLFKHLNKIIKDLNTLKKQYNSGVEKARGNNRCDSETFEIYLKQVLDGTIKEEHYEYLNTEINFVEKVKEFMEEIKEKEFLCDIEEALEGILEGLENLRKIYSTKQFFTDALLEINEKRPGLMRIEHGFDDKNMFNVILPKTFQIFGGHYNDGEFDEQKAIVEKLSTVNTSIKNAFSTEKVEIKQCNLQVNIPCIRKLSDEQIVIFNELFTTTEAIDKENENPITEEKKKELREYDKLKELKQKFPNSYEAMKIRFALGAGLEMYKRKIALSTSSYVSSYSAATYMLQDEYEGIFIKDGDYETPYTITGDSETPFTTNGDSETSYTINGDYETQYTINGNYETPYTINDDIKNEFPELTPRQIKYANDILNDINEGKTIEEIIEEDGIIDEKILLYVEMIRKKCAEERGSLSEIKTNRLKSMKTKIIKAMRKTNTISYR